jgi:hypothetical protein
LGSAALWPNQGRGHTDLNFLLVAGRNLKTEVVRMNIATKTARLHLEHIFAKTQVHRQADLIKLLLTAAVLQPSQPAGAIC